MRIKFYLFFLLVVATFGACTATKQDYLCLNAQQLKALGIDQTDKGVYYKNMNPDSKNDRQRYQCLAFYCTADNYITSTGFNLADTSKVLNGIDSVIIRKTMTHNNFYPLLIGNVRGNMSMENKRIPLDMKLLPIGICMAGSRLSNRNDTIVVWFKPTRQLKNALPSDINIDNYLQTRP